jgi:putative acetyltransferase
MNDTLTIRQEPPDQPDVIRLIAALDAQMTALYPAESNHLLDVAALSDPAVSFLVVRDDRAAIGCGAILRDPRGWGEIKRMYVRPDQRGRGIGRRVLAELEKLARDARWQLLRLETGIHNAEALALYRRAGFIERGAFGGYAADPLSVFMEKRVNT